MALVVGTNAGFVTVAPSVDPGAFNFDFDTRANAFKDTSPATAVKVTEIGVYTGTATEAANIDLAVYTHNAGDDNPEAKIAGGATIAKGTTAGWKVASGLNITISSSTVYWIAAQCDNTATGTSLDGVNDAGERADWKTGQTELTDPWGSSSVQVGRILAIYAVWEAAGTTTTTTTTSTTTTTTTTTTSTTTTTTSTTTTTTTTSTTTTTTSTTTTTTTTSTTTTTTSTTTTTTTTSTTTTTTSTTTTTGVSIATSNIHIDSDDNDIEPNHATDNRKSRLIKDGLEVQSSIWSGGATNYIKQIDGDMVFVGAAGLSFGSFWGNEIGFVTAGGTGTYAEIADAAITVGQTHNTTFQGNKELAVTNAGMYLIGWCMSVEATGANKHIVGGIGVDVPGGADALVIQNDGRNHAISVGNAEFSLAGTAILDLSASSEVGLMVTNESDNTNVTVEHVALSVLQIGGT